MKASKYFYRILEVLKNYFRILHQINGNTSVVMKNFLGYDTFFQHWYCISKIIAGWQECFLELHLVSWRPRENCETILYVTLTWGIFITWKDWKKSIVRFFITKQHFWVLVNPYNTLSFNNVENLYFPHKTLYENNILLYHHLVNILMT